MCGDAGGELCSVSCVSVRVHETTLEVSTRRLNCFTCDCQFWPFKLMPCMRLGVLRRLRGMSPLWTLEVALGTLGNKIVGDPRE